MATAWGDRGGRQAGEHIISAARVVFNRAIADGFVDRAASPAHLVPKPGGCRTSAAR